MVTSVICYVMLRGITGHYGYLFYMLRNVTIKKGREVENDYLNSYLCYSILSLYLK
jgi:hypothetical protein